MLSIAIFFSLLTILSLIGKRASFRITKILLINVLIIECISYLILVALIHLGGSVFLIGNQYILDEIQKHYLVKKAYSLERKPYSLYHIDERLGYTVGENKMIYKHKATNSKGMRALKEFSLAPGENTLRMAAFGDSFVFCDAELTENTWPYMLDKSVNSFEVLNFGVSGYGLGQSYLRYLYDGLQYKPDIVFLNYVRITTRDQIYGREILRVGNLRDVSLYRVDFAIDNGILKTRTMSILDVFDKKFRKEYLYHASGINPDKSIWSNKIFSIFNSGLLLKQIFWPKQIRKNLGELPDLDERINLKILDNFLHVAQTNNTTVILFIQNRFEDLPTSIQLLLRKYSSSVVYVDSNRILNALFKSHSVKRDQLLNSTNHFNAKGNLIYAEAVAGILRARTWGQGNRRFKFDEKTNSFIRLP